MLFLIYRLLIIIYNSERRWVNLAHIVEHHDLDSGLSLILGVIIVIALLVFGYYYGLPALRQTSPSGTQINVPDQIDINVDQQPAAPTN